jgi:hypothetical protein
MKTTTKLCAETTVAARIAGEDIACGDFVTILNEVVELPSFLWCSSPVSLAPEEPVRIRFITSDAGQPRKVIGICLPFIYARTPDGSVTTIDTRQCQLVRLDQGCASAVWKELKPASRKKRK